MTNEIRQSQASTTPSPAPAAPSTGTEPTKFQNGVSQNVINTVKQIEGFSAKAFWDNQQYSIGYGTKANSPDEVIDESEAERRLIRDLNKRQKYVIDYAKRYNYDWNQNQIDSLTSFIHNLGPGALAQVTADGERSNQEIIEKMPLYCYC
jgi:GH24 family phage-related lysozyme (muramidase)